MRKKVFFVCVCVRARVCVCVCNALITSLSSCSASYELLSNDLRNFVKSEAEPETRYSPTSPTPLLSTSLTHAVTIKGTSRFSRL